MARRQLGYWRRQFEWYRKVIRTSHEDLSRFQCNICGSWSAFPRDLLRRGGWSCRYCGSSVRLRSVIHTLSVALFGESLVIADFPHRPDLRGIGLSDWTGFENRLKDKLDYTNTFYHTEPRLDITRLEPGQENLYDFIISSDVFEHVVAPVSTAFENSYRLLKPGGVLVLTVPYIEGETIEHFPDLREFTVVKEGSEWFVVGKTADGEVKRYSGLRFHGGPGTTVECRVFGEDTLRRDCACFDAIKIMSDPEEKHGIHWGPYLKEEPILRREDGARYSPPWMLVKANGAFHT
jgi:SAM-dependent methyltransferase